MKSIVAGSSYGPKGLRSLEAVKELHAKGLNQRQIAEALGLSQTTVWQRLKDSGCSPTRPGRSPRPDVTAERIQALVDSGMTRGQAAVALGCSASHVSVVMNRAGVSGSAAQSASPLHSVKQKRNFNSHLKNRYGIDTDEFDRIRDAQGGACAVCGVRPTGNLCVDHCHATGRVRGLLCHHCNKAIGLLRDSPEACRRAAEYLQAH